MAETLFSAVVTCISSLFIGQAALRLAGSREWSWLAPPIGLSVVMVISSLVMAVPGRTVTLAVLVVLLTISAIIWCGKTPAHLPPAAGLLAATPVVLLTLLPFLAVGRAGILGVTVDNDMASHMLFVENYLSATVAHLKPTYFDLYPVGPHTSVALIAKGLDIRVDHAFAGWTMALPLLNAWTALALVRRAAWPKQAAAVTVISMPFLVAAYYGQGSFKELAQAGFVLATALIFSGYGPALGRGRWIPLALISAGMVSVYSVTGLAWPVVFGGLWLLGTVAQRVISAGGRNLAVVARDLAARGHRELPSLGIGLAVLVIALLPQASRIHNFISANSGSNGIIVPKDVLANLVAPLPGWEAFGVWSNPDYRLPPSPAFTAGMWTAFVVALSLFGAVWMVRRGRWMLPLAAAGSMLIWAVSTRSQSPYVVAKALVISSPLLLALAALPLVEQLPNRLPRSVPSLFRRVPGQPFSWALAGILLVVLSLRVGVSDVRALRASPVGPTDHVEQLRELRPLLHNQPTLFLGDDDFVKWALAGVPVTPVIFGAELGTPIRSEKNWEPGMALDFDVLDAATLNSYRWAITTRDAAGSAPPPQMHLVRATQSFDLWRRVGRVRERLVLAEGGMPGAILDCTTRRGRAVVRGKGVAAVRPQPVEVSAPTIAPGGTAIVEMPLAPGRWHLESTYVSRLPVAVTAPGLHATLPASLDRPGPRWPVGQLAVRGQQPTFITFAVADPLLAPSQPVAELGSIVATRDSPVRVVPVRRACGRYVDWYRSERN